MSDFHPDYHHDCREANRRIAELEAELAALKARRCETCLYNETCDQTEWPTDDTQVSLKFCSAWTPMED